MKHLLLFFLVVFTVFACEKSSTGPEADNSPTTNNVLVDSVATQKTVDFFINLRDLANTDSIMFGQEFPTDFSAVHGLNDNFEQSDSRDIVGDHPAVHGSDFHYYLNKSDQERSIHFRSVVAARERGGVITFDWHLPDPETGSFYVREGDTGLLNDILDEQNGKSEWLYGEFDRVIDIVKRFDFPIIFRPFHEMNGSWFWWHANNPARYVELWKLTVNYFNKHGSHNIIWCWSPNYSSRDYWTYYPGDEWVDVLGLDAYEVGSSVPIDAFLNVLGDMTDHAAATGKIAAFTETGDRNLYPDENPRYWTKDILYPIVQDERARRIAWVLSWFNMNWNGPSGFIPYETMNNTQAKIDFANFYNDPRTLFEADLPDLY